jgi:tRNA pseudouridine32 synthase/23S rRNA pseudouridine746 synthase
MKPSPPIDPFIAPPCHDQIEILYEDEHLLVINKPSGLLSLSGKHPANKDSVHHRLVQDYPTALMVHRLDLGTSGIMVIALNKEINAHLCKQFSNRQVSKTYTALLDGHIKLNQGIIDAPVAKDEFPLQKICGLEGKAAQSEFKVIERLTQPFCTRVIFTPLTGRTHQLRIHSQHLGHSILGCDLYGSEETRLKGKRLMLHATTLNFIHPVTLKEINGQCKCPF